MASSAAATNRSADHWARLAADHRGDPDGHGHVERITIDLDRLGDGLAGPSADLETVIGRAQSVADDDELVAPDAGQGVGGAQDVPEPFGDA